MTRTLLVLTAIIMTCMALALAGCDAQYSDSAVDPVSSTAQSDDQDAGHSHGDGDHTHGDADQANDDQAPPASQPGADDQESVAYVKMTTSKGDIYLELNHEKAPVATRNFLDYAEKKFYDNTLFHRVMPNFMIQGGGFTTDMVKKPTGTPIENEWQNGLSHVRGSLAMARGGPIITTQFFINVVDNNGNVPTNANLDRPQRDGAGYAVFGKVVGGMDIVDAIRAVRTHNYQIPGESRPRANVPVEPVVIKSVRRIPADEVVADE